MEEEKAVAYLVRGSLSLFSPSLGRGASLESSTRICECVCVSCIYAFRWLHTRVHLPGFVTRRRPWTGPSTCKRLCECESVVQKKSERERKTSQATTTTSHDKSSSLKEKEYNNHLLSVALSREPTVHHHLFSSLPTSWGKEPAATTTKTTISRRPSSVVVCCCSSVVWAREGINVVE